MSEKSRHSQRRSERLDRLKRIAGQMYGDDAPSDSALDIIEAVLSEKWECETCIKYRTESSCGWASKYACEAWQARGE